MKIAFNFRALKETSFADYILRFAFGGAITVFAGLLAKEYGPALGGLFLAFPAVFPATSTLIEASERQQKIERGKSGKMRGRLVAAVDARGAIWGSVGLMCFAAFVWTLLARWSAAGDLLAALAIWFAASVALWRLNRWLRFTRRRKRGSASDARKSESHPAEHLRG